MKKYLSLAVILLAILFVSGCTTAIKKEAQPVAAPTVGIPIGTYDYQALGLENKVIATGKLYITANEPTAITGTWEIKTTAPKEKTGPQDGKGKIAGSIEPKTGLIYLDLNPDMRDNNVVLTGIFKDGELSGAWGWYSIAGAVVKGNFNAKLKLYSK
jgi:hypothetical protein